MTRTRKYLAQPFDLKISCECHVTLGGSMCSWPLVCVVLLLMCNSDSYSLLLSRPKLRNIDRSRIIRSQEVTVGDVTVTITEYPLLYPDSE